MGKSGEILMKWLEARGMDVWICTRNIVGGQSYRRQIAGAVRATDVFMPLINEKWTESAECKNEYEHAIKLNLTSVDRKRPRPLILPIAFKGLNWTDDDHISGLAACTNFIVHDTANFVDECTEQQRTESFRAILLSLRAAGIPLDPKVTKELDDTPIMDWSKLQERKPQTPMEAAQSLLLCLKNNVEQCHTLLGMMPSTKSLAANHQKSSTSLPIPDFLKKFKLGEMKNSYLGTCKNTRGDVDVVWSLEYDFRLADPKLTDEEVERKGLDAVDIVGKMIAKVLSAEQTKKKNAVPDAKRDLAFWKARINTNTSIDDEIAKEEAKDETNKVSKNQAIVKMKGTYHLDKGLLEFWGQEGKFDPWELVRLCQYRLVLEDNGRRANGVFEPIGSSNSNAWGATLRLVGISTK